MAYRYAWSQKCAACDARLQGDDLSEGGIFAAARADGWAILTGPRFLCPKHKPTVQESAT